MAGTCIVRETSSGLPLYRGTWSPSKPLKSSEHEGVGEGEAVRRQIFAAAQPRLEQREDVAKLRQHGFDRRAVGQAVGCLGKDVGDYIPANEGPVDGGRHDRYPLCDLGGLGDRGTAPSAAHPKGRRDR